MTPQPVRGFLAAPDRAPQEHRGIPADATVTQHGSVRLTAWSSPPIGDGPVLVLSPVQRTTASGRVPHREIAEEVTIDPEGFAQKMLPPFAAAIGDGSGVTMVADAVGFRQLYHGTRLPLMSTSALLAGWHAGASLDARAVAVQSLLGWQLGQRTLFEGVSKLAPGSIARLAGQSVKIRRASDAQPRELPLSEAVAGAAAILRTAMEKLLDDHPDAVLQLSGGLDSRLLLSAIPPSRRRGLKTMTLGPEDDGDVRVARAIAQDCGLDHEVRALTSISDLSPDDAWERVLDAAMKLDGHCDPLAMAALRYAEEQFEQGVRISGVGGEVARGFYYFGRVRERPYDRAHATRLARWRMFANDAVEPGMLDEAFASWGRVAAEEEVFIALDDGGSEWFHATDNLFLRHRVQRWAGTNDTAVSDDRIVINPMLDSDFLALVMGVRPRDKARSRFFALVQMELDADLGRIPLEGRPAPAAYACPSAANRVRRLSTVGYKLLRKVEQRVRRGNRVPAGADALAGLVAQKWRDSPEILAGSSAVTEFVSHRWIESVLSGEVSPRPSSVALATNLVLATGGSG